MIRSDVLIENRELENLSAFIEAYPQLAAETIADVFNRQIKLGLLDELRYYPGPAVHPFGFATDRSRRYYFASRKGNLPYQRTGTLAGGWQTNITVDDDSVVMSVRNPVKYQKYVTGRRQVPGHAKTGWQKVGPTLDFWAKAAMEVVSKALDKLINQRP